MNCPSPQELSCFADKEMEQTRRVDVTEHLHICPMCQQTLLTIMQAKDHIAQGLESQTPTYIPSFAARSSAAPKPFSHAFFPLPVLVLASFIVAILGLFWMVRSDNDLGTDLFEKPLPISEKTEILSTTIEGRQVDTLLFTDPDSKTTFVWALAKPPM